ncbi:MAG: hypothetical protein V1788_01175, partial [Nanoarchaeota archaeon]
SVICAGSPSPALIVFLSGSMSIAASNSTSSVSISIAIGISSVCAFVDVVMFNSEGYGVVVVIDV